jgi:hypothetical protein
MVFFQNPHTEVEMTSNVEKRLRPSLERRTKEVWGRAAGEKRTAGER